MYLVWRRQKTCNLMFYAFDRHASQWRKQNHGAIHAPLNRKLTRPCLLSNISRCLKMIQMVKKKKKLGCIFQPMILSFSLVVRGPSCISSVCFCPELRLRRVPIRECHRETVTEKSPPQTHVSNKPAASSRDPQSSSSFHHSQVSAEVA